jgi:flagellar motor switch protein FliM
MPVDVTTEGTDRQLFGEYLLRAPREGCFHWIKIEPTLGHALLEMPKPVTGLILDAMLGSLDGTHVVARLPVTEIERRLISKVATGLVACFEEAWRTVTPLSVSIERSQPDCRSVPVAPPDQDVCIIRYRVTVADKHGEITLCLPGDWPAALVRHRVAQRRKQLPESSELDLAAREPESDQVEVVVRLAETKMTSDELAGLSVGDIITTEQDVGETLLGLVDGQPAFRANLGKSGDRKAVQIVEAFDVPPEDTAAVPHTAPEKPATDS